MKRVTPKRVSNCEPSAEDIDASSITMDRVIDMLVGDDLYYHERIRRILETAGFSVRRLEREPYHVVWVCSIKPGNTGISMNKRQASRELRKILAKAGLVIKAGELTVFDRRKEMIRFTFMFHWGSPGALSTLYTSVS